MSHARYQYSPRPGIKGIIGVVGCADKELSKRSETDQRRIKSQAYGLGTRLAELQSVHLLTGGGGGVMREVSHGFFDVHPRAGLILAVIPEGKSPDLGILQSNDLPREYPNQWVEIPIFTHLSGTTPKALDSRNHINIRTANALIVLPGGNGTKGEMELALEKGRPIVVFLMDANDTVGGLDRTSLSTTYSVVATENDVLRFISKRVLTASPRAN